MQGNAPDSSSTTTEGTRSRLVKAMVEVVGSEGLAAASVRTIARRAGCNEAVLYQHFPSKLAMQQAIFEEIVEEMAEAKRVIVEQATDLKDLTRRWVEETYEFYDRNAAAFAYVYLSFPQLPLADPRKATENSRLFLSALHRLDPDLAARLEATPGRLSTARGGMLSIPRDIHEGQLEGPAAGFAPLAASMFHDVLVGDAPA